MTQNCEILVLVANDRNATICSSVGGVTHLLREIDRVPGADTRTPAQSRHLFACEVMMALSRAARERACDGVIIFTEDDDMMEELRQIQTSVVSALMVAHIVGEASPVLYPGHKRVDAHAAFCGAAH